MTATADHGLDAGLLIYHHERQHVVVKVLDADTVLLRNLHSGGVLPVAISELDIRRDDGYLIDKAVDLTQVGGASWQVAQDRFKAIEPLLAYGKGGWTEERVQTRAKIAGVHAGTVYRWLDAYTRTGKLSALLPRTRRDKGSYRLDAEVETIIQDVIENLYLTKERPGVQTVVNDILARCRKAGIDAPHYNTIRRRVQDRGAYETTKRRQGKRAADEAFHQSSDAFPNADHPLSVVQMDHLKLNIELVDDQNGLPIGRAWCTLMIDVRTRMIPGFYLTLEAPSAFSVAMCVANAILPKDDLLAKHGIQMSWPIQGFPRVVHTDNAAEFHGEAAELACDEYHITLTYRPRGRPEFGGHVERMAKTLKDLLKIEEGTTFRNPAERGDYDSSAHATYTLERLEEWVVLQIKKYHSKVHSGLGLTPLQQYLSDVRGSDTRPGSGVRVVTTDPHRLRLDFMPFQKRTIQDYGVQIGKLHYNHDLLRPWIGAPDPLHPGRKRRFVFRYDPRDLSRVYFYDPALRDYFQIPYRDVGRPALSQTELREAKRYAVETGQAARDEEAVFEAHEALERNRSAARTDTRKRRRAAQRKRDATDVVPKTYFETPDEDPGGRSPSPFVPLAGFDEVDFS